MKTNAEDGKRWKKSAYDPRKFFEHCEIWSFADGVDYEALKKQLVRELEHMIETPRNTFRGERQRLAKCCGTQQKAVRTRSGVFQTSFLRRLPVKCL